MAKKKIFSISDSVNRGITETLNAVNNNATSFRYEVISLNRIETDPDNPRELSLTANDIINGLNKSDSDYILKQNELESLQSLAETIKMKGIINPVVVYKYLENYRLVAGERRYLASIIAGKEDVQARIISQRPKGLDLRLLQWIENTEREELSLKDRIGNIQSIIDEYIKENNSQEITATVIQNILGISLPQATCYTAILAAPNDIRDLIRSGKLTNLDKAALLSKVKSNELRQKVIYSCLNGGSIKDLKLLINTEENKQKLNASKVSNKKRGRVLGRINMGNTKNTQVIKTIVTTVTSHDSFRKYALLFSDIDWQSHESTTKAFRKFIELLEKNMG